MIFVPTSADILLVQYTVLTECLRLLGSTFMHHWVYEVRNKRRLDWEDRRLSCLAERARA